MSLRVATHNPYPSSLPPRSSSALQEGVVPRYGGEKEKEIGRDSRGLRKKRCLTEKRREEKKFKLSELALADSVRRFPQDKSGLAGGGSERMKVHGGGLRKMNWYSVGSGRRNYIPIVSSFE